MKSLVAAIALLMVLGASCRSVPGDRTSRTDAQDSADADMAPEAYAYLTSALDTLQARSVFADSVDWNTLRETVLERAAGATTPADTYDDIRFAIRRTGERHGGFRPPKGYVPSTEDEQQRSGRKVRYGGHPRPELEAKLIKNEIGYVLLPRFRPTDPERGDRFATRMHRLIAEVDTQHPCGWIVDLRYNTGGNMWPMLAGIGPVLGEGKVGAFVRRDEPPIDWYYRDGKALMDSVAHAEVEGDYVLRHPAAPVAVLTSRRTGSSGEALVVAFRGRPHTRNFGQATGGVPTAPWYYDLSDGATMVISSLLYMDRTGRAYAGPIEPDVQIPEDAEASQQDRDPVVQPAVTWLGRQAGCRAD